MKHKSSFLIFFQNCQSNDAGTLMKCLTPNLTLSSSNVTMDQPLSTRLHFEMDDISDLTQFSRTHPRISDVLYVVDPKVTPFVGRGEVRVFYKDENYLDIQVRR